MSLNTVFNNIRSREKPNDVFITPRELAKLHIDMLDSWYHSPALDPCRNDDSYYNQFPESDSQRVSAGTTARYSGARTSWSIAMYTPELRYSYSIFSAQGARTWNAANAHSTPSPASLSARGYTWYSSSCEGSLIHL